MNEELLDFIKECIEKDDMFPFYNKRIWRKKRLDIVRRDHCECQQCKKILYLKAKSKYKRPYVHHKKHLKDFPELALTDSNLETLCFDCHEKKHFNERHYFQKTKERFVNEEKW